VIDVVTFVAGLVATAITVAADLALAGGTLLRAPRNGCFASLLRPRSPSSRRFRRTPRSQRCTPRRAGTSR